jgi:hypothetical protein
VVVAVAVVTTLIAVAVAGGWTIDRRRWARRLDAAGVERAEITAQRDAARSERDAATGELATATGELARHHGHLRLLWALEQTRVERTWRHDVAPYPGAAGPLDDGDPVAAAAVIAAGAAREQTGVEVAVDWHLDPVEDPATALVLVRLLDEALAAVVKQAETVRIHVAADSDGPRIVVDARDADRASVPVTLPAPVAAVLAERTVYPGDVSLHGAPTLHP